MLTVVFMAVVLGNGFALGLPLLWLMRGRKPLTESDWLLAPFVGLTTVMLVLYDLVFFEITISRSTPWVWAVTALLWAGLLARNGVRPLLANCPVRVLLVMTGAYGVQGLGLLSVGVKAYLGRAFTDQYNYTSVAQLLADCPVNETWDMIGQRPYLVDAFFLKCDRVGAMLLQAFFACTVGTGAKYLFEPAIILGPALVVLSVYSLGCRLGLARRRSLATAAVAAVLPGLTILQLDCFLSHILAVPVMLYLFVALHDVVCAPSVRRVLQAGIVLAGAAMLYTEFVPVLLLLVGLYCLGSLLVRGIRPMGGGWAIFAVPPLMVGLNPLNYACMMRIMVRINNPTTGFSPLGFDWKCSVCAIWMNVVGSLEDTRWGRIAIGASFALGFLGIAGLLRLAWRGWVNGPNGVGSSGAPRARALLALVMTAISLVPATVLPSIEQHPYQFVKLVLTVGPLLVVGLAAWGQRSAVMVSDGVQARIVGMCLLWVRRTGLRPVLAGISLFVLWNTISMVRGTVSGQDGTPPYVVGLRDPDRLEALQKLEQIHDQPVVLACGPGMIENSWFAYAARNNPAWLVSPVTANHFVVGFDSTRVPGMRPLPFARHLVDLKAVPGGALLLTHVPNDQVIAKGLLHLLWANAHYQLWQMGPGPCTLEPQPAALRP
jgi:hypothetical protein